MKLNRSLNRSSNRSLNTFAMITAFAFAAVTSAETASAQLGKQQGLVEPNVAADSTMAALPHMSAAIAQSLKDARPILSVVTFDSILSSKGLNKTQRTDVYGKAFVHVDINRGTDAELMLIPGVDSKKLNAIKAGRPWHSFSEFENAVAKVTSPTEAARIEQYLFIPIGLNTFTNEIMDTFASIGVGTRQWKREFAEYRPWTSMEQFDREIGKYVRSRPTELARLKRYVIIDK